MLLSFIGENHGFILDEYNRSSLGLSSNNNNDKRWIKFSKLSEPIILDVISKYSSSNHIHIVLENSSDNPNHL